MPALSLVVLLMVAALFGGCASTAPPAQKRHSPAEIAAYGPASFSAPIASSTGLQRQRDKDMLAIAQAVQKAELGPPANASPEQLKAHDDAIADALWNVAFYDGDLAAGRRILQAVFGPAAAPLPQRDADTQRALLTAAHMIDPVGTAPLIAPAMGQLQKPKSFAIAAYTLLRAEDSIARRQGLMGLLQQRSDRDDPRLIALAQVLREVPGASRMPHPPLVDLLAAPFTAGKPVVFSLQRRDRRHIGLAVVRGADGRFVREADGSVFAVPQLAMALTNLPGTITNGNTPQGVFTVVGAGTARDAWIGPTPYLESKLPIEATLAEFAHKPVDVAAPAKWDQAAYEAWLPISWRGYTPFKEAWLAGLAGRDEMLMHGTTIDAEQYRGRSWYPGTPSAGCLVALEKWSPADGKGQRSDQLSLVKAFTRTGVDGGYLVVVDIDEASAPVQWQDVMADVAQAELRLRKN
jgi:hypothetical protein